MVFSNRTAQYHRMQWRSVASRWNVLPRDNMRRIYTWAITPTRSNNRLAERITFAVAFATPLCARYHVRPQRTAFILFMGVLAWH